jgi:hypothetical protein
MKAGKKRPMAKKNPKKTLKKKSKKPVLKTAKKAKEGNKNPVAKHAKKVPNALKAPKGKKGKAKPLTKLEKAVKGNAHEINELIDRGRPRGFVTDNEILYYFPNIEDNV